MAGQVDSFLRFNQNRGKAAGDSTPSVAAAQRPPSAGSPGAGGIGGKRQEGCGTCEQFLQSGGGASQSSSAAARSYAHADEAQRRKLAKEAYGRIRKYMDEHEVAFDGANEVSHIEQAWSIQCRDDRRRRENQDALKTIANILLDYPTMRCYVHGETGKANHAPQALARHLGLTINDVQACMDHLARQRASACLEELVRLGVDRRQLLVSSQGMAGKSSVDFIPEGHADLPEPNVGGNAGGNRAQVEALVEDKRRLQQEVSRLTADTERYQQEVTRLRSSSGTDANERRRADALQAEVLRLRDAIKQQDGRVDAELRRRMEGMRVEAERRARDELDHERRHAETLESTLDKVRVEMEKIVEENRRLKHDLDDASHTQQQARAHTISARAKPS